MSSVVNQFQVSGLLHCVEFKPDKGDGVFRSFHVPILGGVVKCVAPEALFRQGQALEGKEVVVSGEIATDTKSSVRLQARAVKAAV